MSELLSIVVIALLLLLLWKGFTKSATMTEKNSPSSPEGNRDGYDTWVDVFKKEKARIREFDLYGTRAALLWNDGDNVVTVVCITQFRNQIPATNKYDYYDFDIKKWYWLGKAPNGSIKRIMEELQAISKA